MKLPVFSCAGNVFALIDEGELPADPAAFATELCARGFEGRGLDGVLAVGEARMAVYNADGSRPEACGDGLLCVAAHLAGDSAGEAGREASIETDSGLRRTNARGAGADAWTVRGELGEARVVEADVELDVHGQKVVATLVDVGNPHCVLFVDELTDALVGELGASIERHPYFPKRTNVEFVEPRADALRARVWERGVGETQACGTGACALATAAAEARRVELPVPVDYPGGRLLVGRAKDGQVWMEGTVSYRGEVEV